MFGCCGSWQHRSRPRSHTNRPQSLHVHADQFIADIAKLLPASAFNSTLRHSRSAATMESGAHSKNTSEFSAIWWTGVKCPRGGRSLSVLAGPLINPFGSGTLANGRAILRVLRTIALGRGRTPHIT